MTAASKVTLKIDVDNTDALRKIRQVRREARRTRRALTTWDAVMALLLYGFGIGWGVVGLFTHSTYAVAAACMFLLVADR